MSYEAERLAIVRAFAVRREALRKVASRAEWPAVLLALKFEKAMALAALKERRAAKGHADRQERRRLHLMYCVPGIRSRRGPRCREFGALSP
jgi:hypothetical protein